MCETTIILDNVSIDVCAKHGFHVIIILTMTTTTITTTTTNNNNNNNTATITTTNNNNLGVYKVFFSPLAIN